MSNTTGTVVTTPLQVRYFEADQQGVVFNMWYLAYFEDARNAYFDAVGHSLDRLLESGYDIQVVATQISWKAPVRWGDREVAIATEVTRVGESSLTFSFTVRREARTVAEAQTVYVIVGADDWRKRPVPDALREAIGA